MRPEKQADKRVRVSVPIAIKRVLIARTRQLVVFQVEQCESSQLPEVGWDAT